jgi:CDI toxin RNase A-like protein
VGRSDDDLRVRLRNERGIAAASTWTDRPTAERIVGAVISREGNSIAKWTGGSGLRQNLALDYAGQPGEPIGRTLRRGRTGVEPCTDAVVVLRWDNGRREYFVLTSYPEIRR